MPSVVSLRGREHQRAQRRIGRPQQVGDARALVERRSNGTSADVAEKRVPLADVVVVVEAASWPAANLRCRSPSAPTPAAPSTQSSFATSSDRLVAQLHELAIARARVGARHAARERRAALCARTRAGALRPPALATLNSGSFAWSRSRFDAVVDALRQRHSRERRARLRDQVAVERQRRIEARRLKQRGEMAVDVVALGVGRVAAAGRAASRCPPRGAPSPRRNAWGRRASGRRAAFRTGSSGLLASPRRNSSVHRCARSAAARSAAAAGDKARCASSPSLSP